MILANRSIAKALREKKIVLTPPPSPDQFSPSALDLRIGDQFFYWKEAKGGAEINFDLSTFNIQACAGHLDAVRPESDGRIKLKPGEFMLAQTREMICLEYSSNSRHALRGGAVLPD